MFELLQTNRAMMKSMRGCRWGFRGGLMWRVLCVALAVTATRPDGEAAEAAKVESFPLVVPGNTPPGFVIMPSSQTGITFSNFVSTQTRSLYTLIPTGIA